jgi:hypothetical protein
VIRSASSRQAFNARETFDRVLGKRRRAFTGDADNPLSIVIEEARVGWQAIATELRLKASTLPSPGRVTRGLGRVYPGWDEHHFRGFR